MREMVLLNVFVLVVLFVKCVIIGLIRVIVERVFFMGYDKMCVWEDVG